MIRLLIVGDLHGEMPKIHREDFDILISPGDVCGDKIRPFLKTIALLEDEEEPNINSMKKLSLKEGRAVLEKLNSFKKPVILVPGNWDPQKRQDGKKESESKEEEKEWEKLLKGLEYVRDTQHRSTTLKGITFIGHGSTSAPEPRIELPEELFDDEQEYEDYNSRYFYYEQIYQKLKTLFKKSKNPTILLSHNVPYKTKLDKIDNEESYAHGEHYGSRIARELIDEMQPLLCIGGHIHEGHGKVKLGKTICINAGFGGNVNTIVEFDEKEGKILKVEFLGKNKTHH